MGQLLDELKKDIRFIEGLNACINCGVCTAICPAAQFYDYNPMLIAEIAQRGDEEELERLLKSNTIWYCGECLSCKTRCPRGNTPGYIIQALRHLSTEKGFYKFSERGRQQLQVKRLVGDNMLKYGYCVYVDEVDTEGHPEQGPIWDWFRKNTASISQKLGANYKGEGPGSMREIATQDLDELRKIFKETGAIERFDTIEKESENEERR